MSLTERVATLKSRHSALEQQIKSEQSRPNPDAVTLHELKREKLKIKDQINQLA